MAIYWRVRTWTFSASGYFEAIDEPSPLYPFSCEITGITSRDVQTGLPHTLEEGLVCGNSFFNEADDFCLIEFGQAQTSDGLYNCGLLGEVVDERVEPLEFVFSPSTSSVFRISILGVNIPIIMQYMNDEEETQFEITEGSATLTPTEWWSYGGTYDTSTGARL
jgi:hypothetical protein